MDQGTKTSGGIAVIWRALTHRNYRLFFAGQSISLIGTWMTRIATSWLVYKLTGSALLLCVVGFAGQIPTFLLSPFAGVLVDRWNRHRLLVVTQALAMLQSLALGVLALSGLINIRGVILLSFFQGVINAFDMPARQAFVVEMVERREDLANAIALNSSMVNAARLLGPSIGGVIIAAAGEGWCFIIDGVSYLAVIASLLAMSIPSPAVLGPCVEAASRWMELRIGLRTGAKHTPSACAGEPRGHALYGPHASLCKRNSSRWATYARLAHGCLWCRCVDGRDVSGFKDYRRRSR
jgi:MFS family permease